MWQEELKHSLKTAEDLVSAGFVSSQEAKALHPVLSKYGFLLPRYYAGLIEKNNPACPIRLQAIPQLSELSHATAFVADPLQDLQYQPTPRVTHRFKGRVLIHLSPNCSMYCRFCFRKTLLNELKAELFSGDLQQAFEYVKTHPDIEEVIFSGGDPFMATDATLRFAMDYLKNISSLSRVRFHTRVPVTFPIRITPSLVASLQEVKKPVVIVTHFNHPKEITEHTDEAIQLLKNGGFTLLNQSVLLKDVNDSFETLALLFKKLFASGILPYYLHHLDRSEGTHSFEVPREKGIELHENLRHSLSGYLVPRYVQDTVGESYKKDVSLN